MKAYVGREGERAEGKKQIHPHMVIKDIGGDE
jgi:hypothetical protein